MASNFLSRRVLLAQLAAACAACADPVAHWTSHGDKIQVAPSPTAGDEIQAALNQGLEVELLKGTYVLTRVLELRSGARLWGAGSGLTKLVAGFEAPAGQADDPANALIRVQGSVLDLLSSSLAVSAAKDSRSLELTSEIPGLVDEMWVRVRGPNLLEDEYEMSDAAPLAELVQVSGASERALKLGVATMQFHSVGVQVDVVDPTIDVEIGGLDLSAEGGAHAVGIALDLAVDVRLRDISGAGFSRALIELGPGSRIVRIDGLRSRGEVNSMVLASSAMDIHIESFESVENRKRSHLLGVPRGLITFQHRCTSAVVTSGILAGGCVGIRTWGGHHIYFSDLLIRDMDPTDALNRDPLLAAAGVVGVGIDSGAGPLEAAEFGRDVSYDNVHVEGCRQPTLLTQAGWYLHDLWGVTITNCSIVNKGLSPFTPGSYATGMLASDVSGSVDGLTVQGVNYAFRTRNVTVDLDIKSLEVLGTAGEGYNGTVAIWLDHKTDSIGRGPHFRQLKVSNTGFLFHCGNDFSAGPDWRFRVDELQADGFTAHNCILGHTSEAAFGMGEVAEVALEGTDEITLVTPTGPSSRCVVVATGHPYAYGYGYLLVSERPAGSVHVKCTSAAVAYGDLLVASTAHPRRAEVDNAPESPFVVLGKALSAKPAGEEGLVLVGPA